MSSGFWAATDCPTGGYPRVTARAAPSEVNVFNRRRIRDGKWRVFAAGLAAFAFVFCGSVLSRAAVSAETNSAANAGICAWSHFELGPSTRGLPGCCSPS